MKTWLIGHLRRAHQIHVSWTGPLEDWTLKGLADLHRMLCRIEKDDLEGVRCHGDFQT